MWMSDCDRKGHRHLQIFFGERLQLLHIDSVAVLANDALKNWTPLESTLSYLPSLSPNLEELILATALLPSVDIIPTLQQLPKLRRLCIWYSVEPASSRLLDEIRSLPRLQELRVSFLSSSVPRRCSYQPGQVVFPSLKKLTVNASHIMGGHRAYLSLLSPTSGCPPALLEELRVYQSSPEGVVLDLCKAISDTISHNTLTRLFVSVNYAKEATIDIRILYPLLAFKNLEIVSLGFEPFRSQLVLRLDDSSFQALASSWPQLRVLTISADCGTSGPAATIRSLATLVRYCPKLEYMYYEFDASSLTPSQPQAKPGPGPSNPFIRVLNVYPSRQKMDSMLVATYVSDLFPNLDRIRQDSRSIVPYHLRIEGLSVEPELSHWKEVEAALPAAHEQKCAVLPSTAI